jgi:hypothetical protein
MQVRLSTLVLLPMCANLLVIFTWWMYDILMRSLRRAPSARARIYRCAVCEHVYVDARDVPLARCSRCGCLNEAVRR